MKKKQIPMSVLIKLISFYSLIIGIIGTILFFGIALTKQQKAPTPTPAVSVAPINNSPTITEEADGQFCGGIAGKQCPNGYSCHLDGNYPDAGGKCVKINRKPSEETVYCTQEVKVCPDGSSVGRKPPTCAFDPCP